MSTIGDVNKVRNDVKFCMDLFGASEEFQMEYNRKVLALAKAIGLEQESKGLSVSSSTPLGTTSEPLFTELKNWLASSDECFKHLTS